MSDELRVQAALRLDATRYGALWRNNVGACQSVEGGRWIRFGLGNDSKKLNDVWKSSDLIGGTVLNGYLVFTAIECKHTGWQYSGTDREVAQLNFINTVRGLGGIAGFATSLEDYHKVIEDYKINRGSS